MITLNGKRIAQLKVDGHDVQNMYINGEDMLPYLFIQPKRLVFQAIDSEDVSVDVEANNMWTATTNEN